MFVYIFGFIFIIFGHCTDESQRRNRLYAEINKDFWNNLFNHQLKNIYIYIYIYIYMCIYICIYIHIEINIFCTYSFFKTEKKS